MSTSSLQLIDSGLEEIYPNSTDGKYFTATQARIYVGRVFLDEMASVQFTYQGNRIPIYGYSSSLYDALGSGKHLVQGQLAVNYVAKGYLYAALADARKMAKPASETTMTTNVALLSQAVATADALMSRKGATSAEVADQTQQIQALAIALGPLGIDIYNQTFTSGDSSKSVVDCDIPFDIQIQLTGAGRTLTKTLKDCEIISNDQQFDQTGQVLLDCYGFVGRNVV